MDAEFDAMPSGDEKGYVYLLGDWERPGVFKIGVTRGSIRRRIKKLQTGNSGEIYIVRYFHTPRPFFVETCLHRHYFGKRVRDEWFELSEDEVLSFVAECERIEDMAEALKENPFFAYERLK